jgi:hypothetical protein
MTASVSELSCLYAFVVNSLNLKTSQIHVTHLRTTLFTINWHGCSTHRPLATQAIAYYPNMKNLRSNKVLYFLFILLDKISLVSIYKDSPHDNTVVCNKEPSPLHMC